MNKRSELAKKLADKLVQNQPVKVEGKEDTRGAGGGASMASGERDHEDAEFTAANTEEEDPDKFAAFGRYAIHS